VVEFLAGEFRTSGSGDVKKSSSPLARELRDAAVIAHHRIADRYFNLWGGMDNGLPGLANLDLAGVDDGYGLIHVSGHLVAAGRTNTCTAFSPSKSSTVHGW
jgi:hypothetical protein